LEIAPNIVSQSGYDILSCLTVTGHCDFIVILYTSRFPEVVPELYCELGWSVSARKDPPKLSFSLDNRFRGGRSPDNLDPLLHGLSCCLIHCSWEIKLWSS